MKKLILLLIALSTLAWAAAVTQPLTATFLEKKIKIFDIRTAQEWKETGILPQSIPLTFFDERGGYDLTGFLKALNGQIKPGETFALVCHTGSRTSIVANYLGQNGYNVINLSGGIMSAMQQGMKLVKKP